MSALLNWRLIAALLAVFAVLATAALILSRVLLPEPLNFHHTSYIGVAIPRDWRCQAQGKAIFCRSWESQFESRKAVLVMSARELSERYTLDNYEEWLAMPKMLTMDEGSEPSVVEYVGRQRIAGREWVVATHLGSELPHYRTYYAAAAADDIAVLVTLSAHKEYSDEYAEAVEDLLENLVLYKDRPGKTKPSAVASGSGGKP